MPGDRSIGTALPIASNRVGSDKYAVPQGSLSLIQPVIRIYESGNAIKLASSNGSSGRFLSTSEDEAAPAADQRGLGIVLNDKVEAACVDWNVVNSRLWAPRFYRSGSIRKVNFVRRNVFVISAYASVVDGGTDTQKHEFYDGPVTLDIVVIANDFIHKSSFRWALRLARSACR